ncbi:hypothetical protein ACHAO7_006768 [Fusarium culmorum]
MDIPLSHSSTTGNLLRSAPAKALLGHYPPDLFLHIELRRPVPEGLRLNATPASQIDIPSVSPNETDHLVRNYFQLVHRFHPILDQRAFYELYDRFLDRGPQPDLPSALVLVVLALGTVAAETPNRMDACWSPGIRFFTPAVRLLLTESLGSFGGDPLLPQALYLAALPTSMILADDPDLRNYYEMAKAVLKTSLSCESFGPSSSLNVTSSQNIISLVAA